MVQTTAYQTAERRQGVFARRNLCILIQRITAMVDRVLDGYIREFATDLGFFNTPAALQFEHFVNYLLVKRRYPFSPLLTAE
jgi:hypothetical protein